MGINDSYLAFCFDEACEFIEDMRTKEVIQKNGKYYEVEKWKRTPHWTDVKEEKPLNNSSLLAEMKANLDKWKGGIR